MIAAVDKLDKMISLEIEQGYENKAIIGGLDRVLTWWPQQVRKECALPEQQALIDQVISLIREYGMLADRDARARAVEEIRQSFASLQAVAEGQDQGERPGAANATLAPTEPKTSAEVEAPRAQVTASQLAQAQTKVETEKVSPPPNGTDTSMLGLHSSVTSISGIGPTQAKRLERLGISVIRDLLYFFPRRYDDYTKLKPIGTLEYGEQVTIIGTIRSTKVKTIRGGSTLVNTILADGSGTLQVTWFNQPYLVKQFKRGRQIVLSGTVDEYLGQITMSSPTWEPLEPDLIHTGRLVPIYPLTKGIRPRWLRSLMRRTVDYWTKRLPDYLPTRIRERLSLIDLERAVAQMHFPDSHESLAQARRRLAFDEFLILQLGVLRQRRQWRNQPGMPIAVDSDVLGTFLEGLPYELTQAQLRALEAIVQDLCVDRPMSRLLQGDVGSGKTVVAAAAMLVTAAAGYQVALMAPTEILAEQHFKSIGEMLAGHGLDVQLLTGSVPSSEKDAIYEGVASGQVQILIGTHALIQEGVDFENLALVIVDEQHRFGVRQRAALRSKGYNPHLLVMSATPIPRTLALTAYGDLDLSVIDEMPPGRQPVRTRWFMPAERERAYRFLRAQAEGGHQAYVICPLVEESDKVEAKAAVEEYERLQKAIFPDLSLGLLHGRLKSEEKEQVMRQFGAGKLDILVSTSVVEVGIDVPNATVMLIEGANRFGLSQLHQFRGRVGRGEHQSYCILMSDTTTDASEERLRAIEETSDGFKLAEKDLEMRGPGDFFGTRQSGLPELKMASLGDTPLLELARREAQDIFQVDPELAYPDHRLLARKVEEFWGGEGDLS